MISPLCIPSVPYISANYNSTTTFAPQLAQLNDHFVLLRVAPSPARRPADTFAGQQTE